MPQFDFLSFLGQIFWALMFFYMFYIINLLNILFITGGMFKLRFWYGWMNSNSIIETIRFIKSGTFNKFIENGTSLMKSDFALVFTATNLYKKLTGKNLLKALFVIYLYFYFKFFRSIH